MSKMDGLRAMREARYQQAASRSPQPTTRPKAPEKQAVRAVEREVPAQDDEAPALCGHKAISGRTCTREAGHASKSHRYS